MDPDTRLRQACVEGEVDKVREILESAQNVSQEGLDEALGAAARNKKPDVVKELLDHGARITDYAVLDATYSLSAPILQHFVDHGWDVNSVGSKSPALRLVVGSEECTRLLLENGADPNLPGRRGFTPMSTAIGHGTVPVMELLVAYGAKLPTDTTGKLDRNLLLDAIKREDGAHGATKFLLEHGADPNISTSRGTPLFLAIAMRKKEVVACLLGFGVDISRVYEGQTPVQMAEEMGQMDIVALLTGKTYTPSFPSKEYEAV